MLEKIPTVGEGSFKLGQWIQFCTNDPVDEKLETIYLKSQFYFITSIEHLKRFKEERHVYVVDALGKETHKFCTKKMEFDHTSLNKNTQIRFVSTSDVQHALGNSVNVDAFKEMGSAYLVGGSESSVSSDRGEDVLKGEWKVIEGDEMTEDSCEKESGTSQAAEQNRASSSSEVENQSASTAPDGMDLFCPDSENDSDDDLCRIS